MADDDLLSVSPGSPRVLRSGWNLDSARLLAEDLLPASQALHQGPDVTLSLTNSSSAPAVWTNQSPAGSVTTRLPPSSVLLISYPSVTYAPGPLSPVTPGPGPRPSTRSRGPGPATCRVTRIPGPVSRDENPGPCLPRSSRPMPHRPGQSRLMTGVAYNIISI